MKWTEILQREVSSNCCYYSQTPAVQHSVLKWLKHEVVPQWKKFKKCVIKTTLKLEQWTRTHKMEEISNTYNNYEMDLKLTNPKLLKSQSWEWKSVVFFLIF